MGREVFVKLPNLPPPSHPSGEWLVYAGGVTQSQWRDRAGFAPASLDALEHK